MQAQIYDRFSHLNGTDAANEAIEQYLAALVDGKSEVEAEVIGSNVLQRAGFSVNQHGGASFRVASIDHNEVPDARVSLKIDSDEDGFFVVTNDGEDTEGRFPTAADAYASISARWGSGWNLQLAGE